MASVCSRCGGSTEEGHPELRDPKGHIVRWGENRLWFVVHNGIPTSPNPIKAFQQGWQDHPEASEYGVRGVRCTRCGALELFAVDSSPSDP